MEKLQAIQEIVKGLSGIDAESAKVLTSAITSLIERSKFENVEIEKISIDVAAALTTYTKQQFTSPRHKRIIGIAFNLTDEAVLEGCTMYVDIDGKEVFADGTEAKMLFSSVDVAPNQKFYTYVDREINQTPVNVRFTSSAFTAAYKANFYLLCQKKMNKWLIYITSVLPYRPVGKLYGL